MNWETTTATLLALLFSGAQYAQEHFGWEWADWTLRDGVVLQGELRDFDWATKSLVLQREGDEGPMRVAAENLAFQSKLRMLGSAPFHDRLSHHLSELEQSPGFLAGVERLQRLSMVLAGGYFFLFCTLSLMLAGLILRSGSLLRWLESGAAFAVLAALCGGLVVMCVRQFGPHHMLTYVVLASSIHAVLYACLVWAIYRSGPFRALLWYVLCLILAICLPASLGGTVLAAQVHRYAGQMDWVSCDRYLTEVWLRPMGLL